MEPGICCAPSTRGKAREPGRFHATAATVEEGPPHRIAAQYERNRGSGLALWYSWHVPPSALPKEWPGDGCRSVSRRGASLRSNRQRRDVGKPPPRERRRGRALLKRTRGHATFSRLADDRTRVGGGLLRALGRSAARRWSKWGRHHGLTRGTFRRLPLTRTHMRPGPCWLRLSAPSVVDLVGGSGAPKVVPGTAVQGKKVVGLLRRQEGRARGCPAKLAGDASPPPHERCPETSGCNCTELKDSYSRL